MKFQQYLENLSGATLSGDVATFANKVGTPIRRKYPDPITTEPYEKTFKKKKKNKK